MNGVLSQKKDVPAADFLKSDVTQVVDTVLDLTQVLVERGILQFSPGPENVSSIVINPYTGEATVELSWSQSNRVRREWFFKAAHTRALIEAEVEVSLKNNTITLKSERWKVLT